MVAWEFIPRRRAWDQILGYQAQILSYQETPYGMQIRTPIRPSLSGLLAAVQVEWGSSLFLALVATGAIFSDGFESGDTSAWSSAVP